MKNKFVIPVLSLIVGLIAIGAFALSFNQSSNIAPTNKIQVVAAENVWGSLATQLGGDRVLVKSIVSDPNADPHEYESSTTTARAISDANYVVLNGAGYDDWAIKLIEASPNASRKELNVANLVGKKPGDNPHFWYSPDYVSKVVDQITADYQQLDPIDFAYFAQEHANVLASLQPYFSRIATLKAEYTGTKVASTEDIFVYMADAAGLNLISPPDFMAAVAEGNDPSTASALKFEQQLTSAEPKVLIYNTQTSTAVTTNMKQIALSHNVPVIGISEIINPPTATFQTWMNNQLDALASALK